MKGKIKLLMVIAALCPLSLQARGITGIIEKLANATDYHSGATVDVQLPQGSDVSYNIELWSGKAAWNDTLAPCSYLIEWTLPTLTGESSGFTAYENGHLYRHSDTRLQEYHYEWDSIPFLLNNTKSGVQRNAQFTNMLPQFIAEQLNEIVTSPKWTWHFTTDTINNGIPADVLTGKMNINGYIGKEVTYVFDPTTAMPRYVEIENNPTTISEQTLVMKFHNTGSKPMPQLNEQALAARYPEVFDSFRENNFTVETMREKALPAFSLPTTTGERYQRQKNDPFRTPTILALLDPSIATNNETVDALRNAVASMPMAADIIYAFITTDINAAENIISEIQPGEHLLTSARSLARDCGVTSYPTILIVGSDGTVKDVIIGFNKDLSTVVIEKTTLAN